MVVTPNLVIRSVPRAPVESKCAMAVHGIVENRASEACHVRHRETNTISSVGASFRALEARCAA